MPKMQLSMLIFWRLKPKADGLCDELICWRESWLSLIQQLWVIYSTACFCHQGIGNERPGSIDKKPPHRQNVKSYHSFSLLWLSQLLSLDQFYHYINFITRSISSLDNLSSFDYCYHLVMFIPDNCSLFKENPFQMVCDSFSVNSNQYWAT